MGQRHRARHRRTGGAPTNTKLIYRVNLVVVDLSWVDFSFGHFSICLALLWQMGVCQNWLCTVQLGKMMEHPNQSQPNPGRLTPDTLKYSI